MAVLQPDSVIDLGGVEVKSYLLTKHNPKKIAMPTGSMEGKVMGVTIHNTDWINTAPDTTPAEQYTRATLNNNMNSVRVHYYVDNTCAWQNLPLTLSGWHAADGNGNGNRRTIAIECIMSSKYNATDKASEENAAKLAAALLKQFGFGIDHLYTHTYWLNVRDGKRGTVDQLNVQKHPYKTCPLYIIPHWTAFKAKVEKYLEASQSIDLNSDTQSASGNVFAVGDQVYVIEGAIDCNGRSAASIYAGADNPLTIRAVSGDVCLLVKGSVPVYRMSIKYLSRQFLGTASSKLTLGCLVKVKRDAVWWKTGKKPASFVFTRNFYLQSLDKSTGRAVIGTTPKSMSGTVTGALDQKYLEVV